MPATWEPREGHPKDIAYWNKVRAAPGFGEGWKKIKVQWSARPLVECKQCGAMRTPDGDK